MRWGAVRNQAEDTGGAGCYAEQGEQRRRADFRMKGGIVGRDPWETGDGPGEGWPGIGEEEANSINDLEVKEGRMSDGLQAEGG